MSDGAAGAVLADLVRRTGADGPGLLGLLRHHAVAGTTWHAALQREVDLSAPPQPPPTVVETSYDALPYVDEVYADTHPRRIAAQAQLMGHPAPDPATARVLDIGCGLGANLCAIARDLPAAECVGIDIAAGQIAAARAAAAERGVDARFVTADLRALPSELGDFDYIVAHGVYSWTPEPVRDALVALIRRRLTPTGVAFVSANIQPGWAFRTPARALMCAAAARVEGAVQRVSAARAALDDASRTTAGIYGAALRTIAAQVRTLPDAFVAHSYLAADNHPMWFDALHAHFKRHGLAYLGESTLTRSIAPRADPAALFALGDSVAGVETMKDALTERAMRSSLWVHIERPPDRAPTPERLRGLTVAGEGPVGDRELDALFRRVALGECDVETSGG